MAPAFSSTRQAGAFALLLLVLLLLPLVVGKSLLPPREEIYSILAWPYLHQQIFAEKADVDIAIIGSSRVLHGLDTPYLQQQLSAALGRKATVITLGFGYAGFDAVYFIAHDLLANRRVQLIVFAEECRGDDHPHHAAPHLFRFGEDRDALDGLPWHFRAAYYFGAIIGMPRNLLSLLRPDYPAPSPEGGKVWWRGLHAPNPQETLGAACARLGVDHSSANFVEFKPDPGVRASEVSIYSPATQAAFEFTGPPATPLQLHFARRLAALAQAHGTKLVCLHIPELTEMRAPFIHEREFWPDVMRTDVALVGIPPARLFAGLSDEDVVKLFLDPYHFNVNGQEYFTPLVTPALLQIYAARHEP